MKYADFLEKMYEIGAGAKKAKIAADAYDPGDFAAPGSGTDHRDGD